MLRHLAGFYAMGLMAVTIMRRYMFSWVAQLAAVYGVFLIIFFGYHAGAGTDTFGEDTAGLVVGFMVFTYGVSAFAQLSWNVMQEATQGTLEQLAMSPLGLGPVLIYRMIVHSILTLGVILFMLVAMMATTGVWLHFRLGSIIPLLVLTSIGVHGIGFAVGGLAVVFKRVQSSFIVIQFPLIGLTMVSVDSHPIIPWLPVAWGTHLIRRVMIEDISMPQLPWGDLAFLLVNSALWFGLGYWIFRSMENRAREYGLLGQY